MKRSSTVWMSVPTSLRGMRELRLGLVQRLHAQDVAQQVAERAGRVRLEAGRREHAALREHARGRLDRLPAHEQAVERRQLAVAPARAAQLVARTIDGCEAFEHAAAEARLQLEQRAVAFGQRERACRGRQRRPCRR